MRVRSASFAACALLVFGAVWVLSGCGCRSVERRVPHPADFESRIAIRDSATGRLISLDTLLDRITDADVTFLGETHLDEVTHEVERVLLAGLLERTDGRTVLAMEMFARDVQPSIDAYLGGDLDEQEFLAAARPWGNYRYHYRPLVELARQYGAPVVGSNAPRELAMRVQRGGAEAFAALTPAERSHLADEILLASEAYWQRFARVMRGHAGDSSSTDPEAMRFTVQSVWDNTMGQSCAEALDRHPGYRVLHLNGGFHSAYGLGIVEQLRQRRPDVRITTLQVVSVAGLDAVPQSSDVAGAGADTGIDGHYADYVVYAAARGTGFADGMQGVLLPVDLHFHWQLPPNALGAEAGPLLVWLGDDEAPAPALLSYWKRALGPDVVIAVVEPPYPMPGAAGDSAGCWLRPDHRRSDLGPLDVGLERLRDYFVRQHGVVRERIVFAGEGTGGAILACLALRRSDDLLDGALVVAPRRYRFQRELPLPDPRTIPLGATLRVWVAEAERQWWDEEARVQAGVGRLLEVNTLADDAGAYGILDPAETAIRKRLRLGADPDGAAAADGSQRRLLLVRMSESSIARLWAQRVARELRQPGLAVETVSLARLPHRLAELDRSIPTALRLLGFTHEAPAEDGEQAEKRLAWSVADVARGATIPLLPGAFVGPTVLVVPASVPEDQREAWRALEHDNVVNKRNLFARLRVAFEDGGPTAEEVLREEIARGTTEVLVVPARFAATRGSMQRLREELREYEGELHITWVSGLGGELWRVAEGLRPAQRADRGNP